MFCLCKRKLHLPAITTSANLSVPPVRMHTPNSQLLRCDTKSQLQEAVRGLEKSTPTAPACSTGQLLSQLLCFYSHTNQSTIIQIQPNPVQPSLAAHVLLVHVMQTQEGR